VKTLAEQADRHALYEVAVQQPAVMVEFIEEVFELMFDAEPRRLREDFCGTAQLSAAWARRGPGRRSVGVDLDAAVIDEARRRNQVPLGQAADRMELVTADVCDCPARAQVIASLNFSHFGFRRPQGLRDYFHHAHACLEPGGFILLDAYGGPGAMVRGVDERDLADFTYQWEQAAFDPLSNEVVNHIHFRFPDGSTLRQAFSYYWRLWSIAELSDGLLEAGFSEVVVWFEAPDGFIISDEMDLDEAEAWVAYLVGRRD